MKYIKDKKKRNMNIMIKGTKNMYYIILARKRRSMITVQGENELSGAPERITVYRNEAGNGKCNDYSSRQGRIEW